MGVMPRRSPRPDMLDERAFPIRVRVNNPPRDPLGIRLTEAGAWLRENLGPGEYAVHGQASAGLHAMGFYFRSIEAAVRFLHAHRDFDLLDTTDRLAHLRAARNWRGVSAD